MFKKTRGKLVLAIIAFFGVLLIPSYLSATIEEIMDDAYFECNPEDQPCCAFLYDMWSLIGFRGIDWDRMSFNAWLGYGVDIYAKKISTGRPLTPGNNVSSGDIIEIEIIPQGEWLKNLGGYIDTPPINWVENIDDYYLTSDSGVRKCALYDNIMHTEGDTCPGHIGLSGFLRPYSQNPYSVPNPNPWGLPTLDIVDVCTEQANNPYLDNEFQLPTWPTVYQGYYLVGGSPLGTACVGTQVNCQLALDISIDSPGLISCSAPVWQYLPMGDYRDGKQGKYTLTCDALEGASGNVAITIQSNFDCFAYYEKGIFDRSRDWWFYWTKMGAGSAAGCEVDEWCWARKAPPDPAAPEGSYCVALYYPMRLADPATGAPVTLNFVIDSYDVHTADSRCEIADVEISESQLPTDETFNLTYFNMYQEDHGGPAVVDVTCGDNADPWDGNSSCTNPPDNQSGTCAFTCNNYNSLLAGDSFTVHARIENNEKFAECEGTVTITSAPVNDPPYAIQLRPTPSDCCFNRDFPATFSWVFRDPDPGDTQSAYQLQIDGDSDFSSPEIDSGVISSSSEGYAPPGRPFSFNVDYYWRVKVADSEGLWSNQWTYPPNDEDIPYSTPLPGNPFNQSMWPWPEFNCIVDGTEDVCENFNLSVNDPISINNLTEAGTLPNVGCFVPPCTYTWTLPPDTRQVSDDQPIATFTGYNPPDIYFTVDNEEKTITLRATDSSPPDPEPHSCSIPHKIIVGMLRLQPPKWQEIPPFSWVRKILAMVSGFVGI